MKRKSQGLAYELILAIICILFVCLLFYFTRAGYLDVKDHVELSTPNISNMKDVVLVKSFLQWEFNKSEKKKYNLPSEINNVRDLVLQQPDLKEPTNYNGKYYNTVDKYRWRTVYNLKKKKFLDKNDISYKSPCDFFKFTEFINKNNKGILPCIEENNYVQLLAPPKENTKPGAVCYKSCTCIGFTAKTHGGSKC